MNLTRGRLLVPHRSVIYGVPGLGKTSFACGVEFPSSTAKSDVLVLDYENGTNEIDVVRVRGEKTWDASLRLIDEACTSKGEWRTIVLDTADRLEDQAAKLLCEEGNGKAKNLRSLKDFGWNDGFHHLAAKWRELLFRLEAAREHGRSVWIVAHITRDKVKDPTLGEFSEWIPSLHPYCWGATRRWADNVLYAHYEVGLHEGRAIHTGARLLATQDGSGYQAKNRYNLPPLMPLSAKAFEAERARGSRTADEVRASIRALATGDLLAKAEEFLSKDGDDVRRLCATERALQRKLNEVKP